MPASAERALYERIFTSFRATRILDLSSIYYLHDISPPLGEGCLSMKLVLRGVRLLLPTWRSSLDKDLLHVFGPFPDSASSQVLTSTLATAD